MRERSHFVDKVGEKLFPYASGVADFPHWRKGDTDCSVPFLGASAIVIRAVGSRHLKVFFFPLFMRTHIRASMWGSEPMLSVFLNCSPLPSFIRSLSLNLNLADSGILAAQKGPPVSTHLVLRINACPVRPSFWRDARDQNSSPHACTASIFLMEPSC